MRLCRFGSGCLSTIEPPGALPLENTRGSQRVPISLGKVFFFFFFFGGGLLSWADFQKMGVFL